MNLIFTSQNSQAIRGEIKTDINLVRTVSGLNLKINCYMRNCEYVGSCVHNDFCQVIKRSLHFSPENCPDFFINNGIDCTCPFNLPAGLIDINANFDLPGFGTTPLSWLLSGDFNVDLKLTQGTNSILCFNIKFSIKPK